MSPPPSPSSSPLTLAIEGLTCASCVSRIEKALRPLPNLDTISINLTTGLATLTPKPSQSLDPAAITAAIHSAGYRATPLGLQAPAQTLKTLAARHHSALLTRRRQLTFGLLAAIPVLLIDLTHTHLTHIHSPPGLLALTLAQLLLATAILAYTGRPFFTAALRARLHPTMDTLISLGSLTAYLYSLTLLIAWSCHSVIPSFGFVSSFVIRISSFPPPPHTQLHAAVVIIVLVSLGKYLESKAKSAASASIASLAHQSSPTAALLLPDGSTKIIPAEQIKPGDLLQITAHQTLPVDGTLVSGSGSLDQSLLTGEALPLELNAPPPSPPSPTAWANGPPAMPSAPPSPTAPTGHGPLVTDHSPLLPAGALLLDGRIILRSTSTASQSTVSRILTLVQSAQASKTQIQALADQVSAIFVPIVLSLALLTFLAWTLLPLIFQPSAFNLQTSLTAAIATIVIACPCALGLATPTALTVALNRAAKLGILFTNASTLQTAGSIHTVIFDKTGTLTTGRFTLHEILPTNLTPPQNNNISNNPQNNISASPCLRGESSSPSADDLLSLAASIEQFSDHPLALSITAAAQARDLPLQTPDDFSSIPGGGLLATLQQHRYALGSLRFIQSQNIDVSPMQPEIDRLHRSGHTLIALADLGLQDPPMTRGGGGGGGGEGRFDPPPPPNMGGENTPTLTHSTSATRPTSASLRAIFALRDELRPDAYDALAKIHDDGISIAVLSGDREPAVRAALAGLPVDTWLADVKPEEKAGKIAEIRAFYAKSGEKSRKIAFVGDGINDAPALAAADLGIALASGADLAKAAGDVILVSAHLMRVPQTLALARVTFRVIKQNLIWAFAYNLAALPLAMLGVLPPAAAAAAMVLSSLSVVTNALRLYRVKLS